MARTLSARLTQSVRPRSKSLSALSPPDCSWRGLAATIPTFAFTAQNARAMGEICTAGGIPLP